MNRVWANLKSSSLFFKSLQKKLEKTPKNYFKNFQVDFETAAQNLLSWIPTLQRTACVWFLIFHAVWPLTIWTCSNKITFNIRINFTLPQHAMITFIPAKRNRKSMRRLWHVFRFPWEFLLKALLSSVSREWIKVTWDLRNLLSSVTQMLDIWWRGGKSWNFTFGIYNEGGQLGTT